MKNSVYFRIFIATSLIVLLSFSLLGGLSTAVSYRRTMSDKRELMLSTLHETGKYIVNQKSQNPGELNGSDLNMWLTVTSGITGFDLFVTDVNGVVKACSDTSAVNYGKTVPEDMLKNAETNGISVTMSTLGEIYPERRQISGMPLKTVSGGDSIVFGHLFVSSNVSLFRQEWSNFYSIFIVIALIVMIFAFIVTFVATKKQAEPLYEMVCVARRFTRGEFDARAKDHGRYDEIGQLTEAFNAMADTLESAEQLRRDFITNLSHELRTPMTVIAGFAEGLLDGTIPREEEAKYLSIISSETRRLSRLVRSMTEISTLKSADTNAFTESVFDVSEAARLALVSLASKIEKKQLDVTAQLPEEAVMTYGDADSITQVIYNLIDNAIKFSDFGRLIELELLVQNNRAQISVTNRGEIIPADELPHIFDRFHKADRSRSADREGPGLGLFIVKQILDNHNEDIHVSSTNGITKFEFSLNIV